MAQKPKRNEIDFIENIPDIFCRTSILNEVKFKFRIECRWYPTSLQKNCKFICWAKIPLIRVWRTSPDSAVRQYKEMRTISYWNDVVRFTMIHNLWKPYSFLYMVVFFLKSIRIPWVYLDIDFVICIKIQVTFSSTEFWRLIKRLKNHSSKLDQSGPVLIRFVIDFKVFYPVVNFGPKFWV